MSRQHVSITCAKCEDGEITATVHVRECYGQGALIDGPEDVKCSNGCTFSAEELATLDAELVLEAIEASI